jgi:hypothetical protein
MTRSCVFDRSEYGVCGAADGWLLRFVHACSTFRDFPSYTTPEIVWPCVWRGDSNAFMAFDDPVEQIEQFICVIIGR